MPNRRGFGFLLISLCLLGSCKPANKGPELSALESARKKKDLYFRSDENSPIPSKDRAGFKGLNYFPENSGLRFQVRLIRYSHPEPVRLGTNTGEIRDALRYGYISFQIPGKTYQLQAYRTMEDIQSGGKNLFVPFRDTTAGKETYGTGRYLDFEENTSGLYDLDFNRAYNPYCAYANSYSCPLPPPENHLGIAIEAGEKVYK
jgi:uncharacterized protein (DUF1684 family)